MDLRRRLVPEGRSPHRWRGVLVGGEEPPEVGEGGHHAGIPRAPPDGLDHGYPQEVGNRTDDGPGVVHPPA